jgi:hypothetical protein
MITRIEAERSVTQLLCLILGGKQARASSHFSHSVSERLEFCLKLVQQEMQAAIHNTDPDQRTKAISIGQRKLTSIQSLKTLNQLIQECEW